MITMPTRRLLDSTNDRRAWFRIVWFSFRSELKVFQTYTKKSMSNTFILWHLEFVCSIFTHSSCVLSLHILLQGQYMRHKNTFIPMKCLERQTCTELMGENQDFFTFNRIQNMYCQAQPKPQLQLKLWAELVIISVNPPTHPTGRVWRRLNRAKLRKQKSLVYMRRPQNSF